MSSGHYHRRWSAGTSAGGRTTPTSSLTSSVEPSTYGTSWNSVRWNKPSATGYRSHSSSIAAKFEPKTSYTSPSPRSSFSSRYTAPSSLSSEARNLTSLGPSVTARASRFDSTVRDVKDKYRSEARELLNKWSSRERSGGYFSQHFQPHKLSAETFSNKRASDTASTGSSIGSTATPKPYVSTKTSDYPYRKTASITPTRTTVPSVARYSSVERSSFLSPSPTPQTQWSFSTPYLHHTPKSERPWRQRMAESSRIRAAHGDDYISKDSSVFGPTSRFSTSGYSGYPKKEEKPSMKYMSKSYSPVRSPSDVFRQPSIPRMPSFVTERGLARQSSNESISVRDDSRERQTVSAIPKNPTIRESSRERDTERKKNRSSRERTARRNSRQRSQNLETSSSSGEESKEEAKRKRRKKKSDAVDVVSSPATVAAALAVSKSITSMNSSLYETGKEDEKTPNTPATPGATCLTVNASENDDFQSCAGSPRSQPSPGQRISRQNSKTRLPSKSQIIKSPSLVEVPGISKSDSRTKVESPPPPIVSPPPADDISQASDLVSTSSAAPTLDDSQYSAVAHFKPFKPKVKRVAPVPGLWNRPGGEENISKNKKLVKEESHLSTFIIWKIKPKESITKKFKSSPIKKPVLKTKVAPAPEKKAEEKKKEPKKEPAAAKEKKEEKKEQKITETSPIKKLFMGKKKAAKVEEEPEPPKLKEETMTKDAAFNRKPAELKVSQAIKDKRRVAITHPRKIRAVPQESTAGVAKQFSRPPLGQKTSKTIRTKVKTRMGATLSCAAPKSSQTSHSADFVSNKENQRGAQVIVDTPQKGVNAARAKMRIKAQRHSMPEFPTKLEKAVAPPSEVKPLQALIEDNRRSMSRESQSRAAELLDEMRYTEPALEWKRDDSGSPGHLVLPDQSILEEYIKRKRGRLERLSSEPLRELDESGCQSPCNSTTSELLPAAAVRVFERSPRGVPVITTPSRTSSVEASTPTGMLEQIQPVQFNNFNSTPQAFLRNNSARQQCAKPIQFDAPKTLFEERLQQQANAIRKASVASNLSQDDVNRDPSPRRGSQTESMQGSISSTFTAAMAEKAGQPRHERYAAHIPVNRGETSGRHSAASVESSQSGVLDAASKQLDQVIDQARHRHHQHRSRFKEAIDYLDQIFEDLKKECDLNAEERPSSSDMTRQTQPQEKSIIKPTVIQPTATASGGVRQPVQQTKSNSLPNRGLRHKPVQPPSPVELILPKPQESSPPSEIAVAETIVLPKKTDKLDFTRRWLQDDLSSLAHQPPAPIMMIGPETMYGDIDEHSLGSCSAEVAAINANKKEKKKNGVVKPTIVQPAMLRPQPQRPQPTYGAQGSSNGTRHFPVELEAPSLQRVASFDMMPEKNNQNGGWRSGSQEPYQTLASVRSEADCRPSPSAFTNVNALQRAGNRGSLRSLPDASIVRPAPRFSDAPKDPAMAIDALVAELELNTDQPMSTADKRRSFPTSLRTEAETRRPRQQPQRARVNGYTHIQPQPQPQPQPQIRQYHAPPSSHGTAQQSHVVHRQQRSLDEVANMLHNVVGELGAVAQQPVSKRKSVPFGPAPLGSNPFETINQEKINPSRVEAMHNMFERGNSSTTSSNGRRPVQQQQSLPHNLNQPQPFRATGVPQQPPKEEENYYDLAEFAVKSYKRVSPPRQIHSVTVHQDFVPPYPLTQPPQHPPSGRNGSANSSTNGGYYSSTSSTAGPSQQQPGRRGSLVGRQSMLSSRAPSVEDEDDGFYDNIGVFEDRRYSRGSELDVASLSSARQLPPSSGKGNRFGSFLRKIGGSSRPPGAAASLISLNKVANEAPIKHVGLMKSSSLSTEPWRKEVLQQNLPREGSSSKTSLGSRLKHSLFGSKKRING